jgi:hypothetical protein
VDYNFYNIYTHLEAPGSWPTVYIPALDNKTYTMGIFKDSSSNHICSKYSLTESKYRSNPGGEERISKSGFRCINPFIGHMSFYRFNKILSGSCTALASLVIIALMFMHETHLSNPNEKVKSVSLLSPQTTVAHIFTK